MVKVTAIHPKFRLCDEWCIDKMIEPSVIMSLNMILCANVILIITSHV